MSHPDRETLLKLQSIISEELINELHRKYSQLLKKELNEAVEEEKELPRQELSCEEVKMIGGKVYYVIGDKYIQEVRKKEKRLKTPPIYFRSGECKEMLKEMGITEEGIYLVEKGKVIAKVFNPQ